MANVIPSARRRSRKRFGDAAHVIQRHHRRLSLEVHQHREIAVPGHGRRSRRRTTATSNVPDSDHRQFHPTFPPGRFPSGPRICRRDPAARFPDGPPKIQTPVERALQGAQVDRSTRGRRTATRECRYPALWAPMGRVHAEVDGRGHRRKVLGSRRRHRWWPVVVKNGTQQFAVRGDRTR